MLLKLLYKKPNYFKAFRQVERQMQQVVDGLGASDTFASVIKKTGKTMRQGMPWYKRLFARIFSLHHSAKELSPFAMSLPMIPSSLIVIPKNASMMTLLHECTHAVQNSFSALKGRWFSSSANRARKLSEQFQKQTAETYNLISENTQRAISGNQIDMVKVRAFHQHALAKHEKEVLEALKNLPKKTLKQVKLRALTERQACMVELKSHERLALFSQDGLASDYVIGSLYDDYHGKLMDWVRCEELRRGLRKITTVAERVANKVT